MLSYHSLQLRKQHPPQLPRENRIPTRPRQHIADTVDALWFTPAEVESLRLAWQKWFREPGVSEELDWSVDPGQPYCLKALHALSPALQDPDVHVWPALQAGVPELCGS